MEALRTPKHVAEFSGEGCKLRRVAPVGREREDRALNGESDAADEELGAVSERGAGIGEAGKRVGGPGGLDRGSECGGQSGATRGRGSVRLPAERWDGPRPAEPSSARRSAAERGEASGAGWSSVRSSRTRRPDTQPRSAQRQAWLAS